MFLCSRKKFAKFKKSREFAIINHCQSNFMMYTYFLVQYIQVLTGSLPTVPKRRTAGSLGWRIMVFFICRSACGISNSSLPAKPKKKNTIHTYSGSFFHPGCTASNTQNVLGANCVWRACLLRAFGDAARGRSASASGSFA